ncbi:MAG: glycosyltransferase involved in cell wall biosynthesis [Oceanicoccus sp.]|jgi:glycosyltransferase involved in cell wall biosynthesis
MQRLAKRHILVTRFPFESQWGGEEVHTLSLMCALDKKGYEAAFLGSCPVLLDAFKKDKFPVKKTWLSKPPVTKLQLIRFTLLSPLLFLMAGWQLFKMNKQFGVDTVYMLSLTEKLLMTPWARLFRMKVIWMEHARIGKWLTHNPWRHVYKRWSKWAKVVVTSNAMVKYVAPLVPKVKAISCAVILDKSAPLPKEISAFLKGGFAVGNVSRLTVDKGVDMIVRLVHSKPDMRLILVGDGPLRQSVQKAAESKQVMWVKSLPREQLMSLYKSLDLFILASKEMDPFGMVAAEAMWHGTPTIVTDQCGISEDLHNGQDALIVPAKFSLLDRAVKKLMRHEKDRKELGRHGQDFVKKHYVLSSMVSEFENLV